MQRQRKTLAVSMLVAFGLACVVLASIWLVATGKLSPRPPGDPDSPEFWIWYLENGTTTERVRSIHVLDARDNDQAEIVSALIRSLEDPSPEVRLAAVLVLRDCEPARDHIRRMLNDSDADVRRVANQILDGNVDVEKPP